MISVLVLPEPLRTQLIKEARKAFPHECCGLVEATFSGSQAQATALHATRNLSVEPDRFEIDPEVQFTLMRGLRGTARQIIGCYHSHPNGRLEPSGRDLAAASEHGFLWLIAALEPREELRIAAFVSTGIAFSRIRVVAASLDRIVAPPV
jgi:proteasome lid subunit RPN8/RPN11